jgi:hypothetical protein
MEKVVSEQFEFKYEGNTHFIDINTLLSSQFHFAAILQEIKSEIYPDVELKIKVKAFEKGSFNVNQLYEIAAVGGMFALENYEYIKTIFTVLKDFISLKKTLKGEKAEMIDRKGNDVIINFNISGKNNKLTVDKKAFEIFQYNPIVNNAFDQSIKLLDSDEEIQGIKLSNTRTNKALLEIPREDFQEFKFENPYINDVEDKKEKKAEVVIGIHKWVTTPKKGSKWSFIYQNRIINQVVIKDDDFLRKIIDEKLRFGAGDALAVLLRVKLTKDEASGMYLESKFEVLKVNGIKWRGEQIKLF